jgi:multidrug resistance efflux pump
LLSFLYIYLAKKTRSHTLNFDLLINKNMRINELVKPKTPEQLKLDQLRATRERATTAVQQERERQKTQRAQKALQLLAKPKAPSAKTTKPIGTIKPIAPIAPIKSI